MTNAEGMTKLELRMTELRAPCCFEISHAGLFRHSSFGFRHFFCDLDRQFEGRGRLKSGHARFASACRAFNERDELVFQRFLPLDRHFVARDLTTVPPINFAPLTFVIEREI